MMPGTCGELVQGAIDGVAFHVSCPIDIFSVVTVELSDANDEWIFPSKSPKAASAVRMSLEYFGASELGGQLFIESHLPRAKGMASSTADVAGAIYAVALALGHNLTYAEVAAIALRIEPSDGSIFPGIALFDHRKGSRYAYLGPPPAIDIVVLDFGGEVDTVSFNAEDKSDLLQRLQPQSKEALEMASEGLRVGDLALIGKAATLSALANQEVLYKPELDRVLRLAEKVDALGVNIGHSGTVIGVFLDRSQANPDKVAAFLVSQLPGLERARVCRLIDGGYRKA